jgi:aspartyl-tRNA(Asn)/glutamyl-tRNA(Gln) amidotransferase subunit C
MLKKEDIDHLATLARLALAEEEKEAFAGQLDAVLGYVSEVSTVVTEEEVAPVPGVFRNVLREDTNPYPGGTWSETILANAPHRDGNYVKVGQIF